MADLKAMLVAFNDKDTTIGAGLNISGQNYEVHRCVLEQLSLSKCRCGRPCDQLVGLHKVRAGRRL